MDTHHIAENKAKKFPQVSTALVATLGSFGLGMALTWTSPALLEIDETICGQSCDIQGVSEEEASWIAAVFNIALAVAAPITGYFMNTVGRKWVLVLWSLPMALGFASFVLANAVDDNVLLHVGRVLNGFGSSAFLLTTPIYLAEIAEASLRGALANVVNLTITLGQAIVNALSINGAVSWHVISAICITVPILQGLTMLAMPETPRYLISKGRNEEAAKALQRLRGKQYDISEEMDTLLEDDVRQKSIGSVSLKTIFSRPVYYKPFLVVTMLMFVQQFSGINLIMFYTQEIFYDAGSDLDPGLSAFIVTMAKATGSLIGTLLVERFGRRVLLLFSESMTCICLFPLGTYFYLQENSCLANHASLDCIEADQKFSNDVVKGLSWLPLVSLIVYMITFAMGLGSLPWTINAEIYPAESKSVSSSLVVSISNIFAFFVTKFQPEFEQWLGASGMYFLFGSTVAVGVALTAIFLPETKGKGEADIRNLFDRNPSNCQAM